MKKLILFSLILFAFAACQKAAETPAKIDKTPKDTIPTIKYDTIPDKAKIDIQLYLDASGNDNVLIEFNHKSHFLGYIQGEDSIDLGGFGPRASLSVIASDGTFLVWDGVPYKRGMSIDLFADGKENGTYNLGILRMEDMPPSIEVWCKDTYLKDSLNIRKGNYYFKIDKANPKTFGKDRFKIVFR